jgi:hypothetical protein
MKSRLKALILTACALSLATAMQAQTTLFTEDFEGATLGVTSSSSSGNNNNAWALNTNLQSGGLRSDSAQVKLNDSLFLETSAFSTVGFANVALRFDQICKIDFFDRAIVQYSTNNGSSWTTLGATAYTGSGTLINSSFSSASYLLWDPANINATPTNSWWRSEGFDISASANNAQVKLRFVLIDADNNGPVSNYGWLLDDIEVVGAPCELIPPTIALSQTIYQGTTSFRGPYQINANITDASGVASARIIYTLNGVAQTPVSMSNIGANDWQGTLPAAQIGDTICYRIEATDNTTCANVGYLPSSNGCIEFDVVSNPPPPCVGTTVSSYPYLESFATFTPGNGSNTAGTLRNSWVNENTDTHDWWVLDRATTSVGTGPSADHSPGDANYMYVESSGTFSNTTAILNTPCFDLSTLSSPKLEFYYHMWDQQQNQMGDLHLDVYFGGQWVLDIMPIISGDQGQNWNLRLVDLSAYAGNTIKLRFRAEVGSGFRSDIAIDDISIFEPLSEDMGISGVFSPSANACTGSSNQFVTLEISNFGSQTQDTIPLAYTLNGGGIVRDTAFLSIPSGDTVNFTFQQPVNMGTVGAYDFDFWVELPGDQNLSNDTVSDYIINTSALNSIFPDTTNFDNFTVGIPGTLLDGWSNDPSGDLHDWYVRSGTTPSSNTGPSGDNTSGLGNYMYVEATGFFNQTANLFSKCWDISNLNQPEVEFYYHMLGGSMGDLHLDININGILIQDIMPVISGNQGSNWLMQTVDLTPYKGNIKLIFRAEIGGGFQSDIAIDDVVLIDRMPVGVESLEQEQEEFKVFPNPAREVVNLLYNSSSQARLQIFNMNGQLVYEAQLSPNSVEQIDVSAFSAGLYQLRLSNESGVSVEKLIIE